MRKYILIIILAFTGCEDFLDEKPDQALVVPTTVKDLQALLDNYNISQTAGLGLMGADNFYITDADYNSLFTDLERNAYIWAEDIFGSSEGYDWNTLYSHIFYTNVVLDGIKNIKVTEGNKQDLNFLKGQALFLRSFYYYDLLQLFAPAYVKGKGDELLGIPIKNSSDVNEEVFRPSLKDNYDKVIEDLQSAVDLLPEYNIYKTRASKPAAYALMARVYLNMADYEKAKEAAVSCLKIHHDFLDYNNIDVNESLPFLQYNEEVIFHAVITAYGINYRMKVAPELIAMYGEGDLRLPLFFRQNADGTYTNKGSYGERRLFSGIAADEVILILAECKARLGDYTGALEDLNFLLEKRWESDSFEEVNVPTDQVLDRILEERRKELVFRGIRWSDLRRLNQELEYSKTLKRTIDDVEHILPPNDLRYVYPIPAEEIKITGMVQNDRG